MASLLLSFFVSISWGQNNQLPMPSMKSDLAQQAVQGALNNKFSVYGGTVSGNAYLSTTTVQEICFQDGTCQTTAALAASGNNTFTGVNTFAGLTDTITGSTHTLSGTPTCSGFSCDLLKLSLGNTGTSYISIAGLPANAHIQIECSSCSWTTGTNFGWLAQFNGNNGAGTYYSLSLSLNTTGLGANGGSQTNCGITNIPVGGGSNAGSASDFTFDIWTTKNGHAAGQAHGNTFNATHYNDGNTRYVQEVGSCTYTVIDATINQVTFYNTGGTNLTIGTLTVRIIQ